MILKLLTNIVNTLCIMTQSIK